MVPCTMYMLIIEKCNFCTHFTIGPSNGPLYRLIGEIVSCIGWLLELPQFWPHFTVHGPLYRLVAKMATFWHHFIIGHQMVPCRGCFVIVEIAIFCHTILLSPQMVPHTGWLFKLPYFGPTLILGHQMVPHTDQIDTFWPHSVSGPPDGPPYRQNTQNAKFWSHFVSGPPNGPLYRQNGYKWIVLHAIFGTTLSLTELQLPMEWAI